MSSTRHQQLDEEEQYPPSAGETPARTGNRSTTQLMRKVRRGRLRLPITLSVVLMVLNIALMVFWIILAAQIYWWT
ncbi:MAG: sensor histidine kinase, partial [Planctomycetaceae bacterium]|nr:sensor histidine kinase [Planctomycetaceae bacterium]